MRASRWIAAAAVGLAVVGGLAFYLFDPDARLRGWVRGEPTYRGRSASAWLQDFRSTDANTRAAAAGQLKDGGGDAVPVLEAVLRAGGPPEPRTQAADVLGKIGEPARPAGGALIAALGDPEPFVRAAAAKALGQLAPDVPGAVPALADRFPDGEAVRAVARFGPAGADAVPKLIPLLSHADPYVRWNAARTLQKIGPAAAPAVPQLIAQLTDPDPLVREHAAEAFGPIGAAASAVAVPNLVNALDDGEWKVRRDALRSLGQLGPTAKDALPKVRVAKSDPEAEVREFAARAERQIDPSVAGKQVK